VRNTSNGTQWVRYIGANGQIAEENLVGSTWSSGAALTPNYVAAANASPVSLLDPSSGDQWVYYMGSEGQVGSAAWNGASWTSGPLVAAL
jgi:hypothetical protein